MYIWEKILLLYKVSYFADVDINGYEVQGIDY